MASDLVEVLELDDINSQLSIEEVPCTGDIKRFKVDDLSYNDFYWQYMARNWPVILCDVSTQWECRQNWLTSGKATGDGINYKYLKEKIGNCRVPVANCKREYFNSHAKIEMNFYDFLDYWQRKTDSTCDDPVANTELSNRTTSDISKPSDLLYLKDWHLKSQQPNYNFYKVPKHFASDWLNEHLVATQSDDYRFVYMGPKDTWTSFHSDVFGSFSWSTNIMGIKKWLLMPPGEEMKLTDRLGNLPFRIDEQLLNKHQVRYHVIMQKENESLFVPSGWYHQVWNITDTISVNHNWFNACNLQRIWHNLKQQMRKVIAEIEDCRQMDNFMEHCQTMLRASFGINYLDFIELLQSIVHRRCAAVNNNTATPAMENVMATAMLESHAISNPTPKALSSNPIFFEYYTPNKCHMLHDLRSILQVAEEMLQDTVISNNRIDLYRKCIQLRESATTSLSSM